MVLSGIISKWQVIAIFFWTQIHTFKWGEAKWENVPGYSHIPVTPRKVKTQSRTQGREKRGKKGRIKRWSVICRFFQSLYIWLWKLVDGLDLTCIPKASKISHHICVWVYIYIYIQHSGRLLTSFYRNGEQDYSQVAGKVEPEAQCWLMNNW